MKLVLKNYYLLFGLLSLSNIIYSQERVEMTIQVYVDSLPTTNGVEIENLNLPSIARPKSGEKIIKAGINDIILIFYTPLNYKRQVVVSEKIMNDQFMAVYFNTNLIVLNEVIVTDGFKYNSIPGTEKAKKLSPAERKLIAAGKEDLKLSNILHNLYTKNIIAVDPFINVISGRMKKLKKELSVEKKQKLVTFLKNNYSDFMKKKMLLEKDKIGLFFYYVADKNENLNIDNTANLERQLQIYYMDFLENSKQ